MDLPTVCCRRSLSLVITVTLLAIWVAGAYAMSQSSNYNGRCRAAEVLVDSGRYRVIRKRESFDDLVRGQVF